MINSIRTESDPPTLCNLGRGTTQRGQEGRMAMVNSWPITAQRLEQSGSLTPIERVYLEVVVSEFWRRGPFYAADLELAVTLAASESKIRQARRRVGAPKKLFRKIFGAPFLWVEKNRGRGLIVYKPGWRNGAKRIATSYVTVPSGCVDPGEPWAPIPRYTFETLLSYVRAKRLTHADVVFWLILAYKEGLSKKEGTDELFSVTKRELQRLSGVANVTACVQRLYQQLMLRDGGHLFEYIDENDGLVFSKWTWYPDPSEDEGSARRQKRMHRDIAAKVAAMKRTKKERLAVNLSRLGAQTTGRTTNMVQTPLSPDISG